MATTTLQTDHGQYLRAEDGGGTEGLLVGTRPQGLATAAGPDPSAWQTFTFERDGDLLYLKSCGDEANGIPAAYGCAENEGTEGYFVFNRPVAGGWEALRPVKMADGRDAFEIDCRRGYFLCAEPDGRLTIRKPQVWSDVEQKMVDSDEPGGYESFLSSTDLYHGVGGGGGQPGVGIPLAGPVRTVEEVFVDDNGAFLPIGCHFGEAFSAWTRGRQDEVRQQIRVIKSAGYDHIRTWLNLGYYDSAWHGREVAFTDFYNRSGALVRATPQYEDHRAAFNDMLVEEGMRGLFSRGDCISVAQSAIEAHLQSERRILSHTPQVLFGVEFFNEKWQNAPEHLQEDEPEARNIMDRAFGGAGWLLQNSCPPGSSEEATAFARMVQDWFPCGNVHGTRDFGDMETLLRHFFGYGYERYPGGYRGRKYAMQSTEPGGPGSGVSVGNTSDVWKIVAMHAATLIGRLGTVYMSGHGVFWNGPIENQPGFWEVPKLRGLFNKDAFWGQAVHGNRGEAWVTSAGGMNNVNPSGYARMDQLLYERDGVCIAHHGGGGRKPVFKYGGTARIVNFEDLSDRMTFDVSPGHVQDIGGDALIIMRRG